MHDQGIKPGIFYQICMTDDVNSSGKFHHLFGIPSRNGVNLAIGAYLPSTRIGSKLADEINVFPYPDIFFFHNKCFAPYEAIETGAFPQLG